MLNKNDIYKKYFIAFIDENGHGFKVGRIAETTGDIEKFINKKADHIIGASVAKLFAINEDYARRGAERLIREKQLVYL